MTYRVPMIVSFVAALSGPAWASTPMPCFTEDDVAPAFEPPDSGAMNTCESPELEFLYSVPNRGDTHPLNRGLIVLYRGPQGAKVSATVSQAGAEVPVATRYYNAPTMTPNEYVSVFALEGASVGPATVRFDFLVALEDQPEPLVVNLNLVEREEVPSVSPRFDRIDRYRETFDTLVDLDGCYRIKERNHLAIQPSNPQEAAKVLYYEYSVYAIWPDGRQDWTAGTDARVGIARYGIVPDLHTQQLSDQATVLQGDIHLAADGHCYSLTAYTQAFAGFVISEGCNATACIQGGDKASTPPAWETYVGGCPRYNASPQFRSLDELRCTLEPDDPIVEPPNMEPPYMEPPYMEPPYAEDPGEQLPDDVKLPNDEDVPELAQDDFGRREGNWGGCACRSLPLSPGQHGPLWALWMMGMLWMIRSRRQP